MKLMEGKKGVIFGVSNTHGIAYGIAKQLFDRSYYYYQATKVITVDNKTPSQITLEILNTLA